MNKLKPELLSPAGSYDALIAAVNAGCNAVYLGGEKFGARANAKNFSNEDLPKAIDFAHLHDVKVYFTANTLIKESEMQAFLNQVSFLYQEGIDGLIVQDVGAINILKSNFPDLPLHASTQMTVHSLNGVKVLKQLGFERVVLSRELSLKEIREIIDKTQVEIECFVHGALCYSYSGQCLFSSLIGGRSGNRGTCAQPCRLPYDLLDSNQKNIKTNGKYLLSPKDIQTLQLIPDFIESGIHSFKIEGRMKNANYVGLVTYIYRKYIDLYLNQTKQYKVDEQDILKLSQIYNRGGFSNGYYYNKNGLEMMSPLRPNHQGVLVGEVEKIVDNRTLQIKLNSSIKQGDCLEITSKPELISFTAKENMQKVHKLLLNTKSIKKGDPIYKLTDVLLASEIDTSIIQKENKLLVDLSFTARVGRPSELKLIYKEYCILVNGDIVEQAKTSAISEDKLQTQLTKTGNDPILVNHIDLYIDKDIFISIKGINQLRREAIELLLKTIILRSKRKTITVKYNKSRIVNPFNKTTRLSVLVRNKKQFEVVKDYEVDNIYFELTEFNLKELGTLINICHKKGINSFIALPRIIRQQYINWVLNALSFLREFPFTGTLIRTLDAFELVNDKGNIVVDYTANTFNNEAIDFWLKQSISKIAVSPELNNNELSKLKGNDLEVVIYGYLPLMVTAQCAHQFTNQKCDQNNNTTIYLKDRKNINFKYIKDCKMCLNTIYNSLPIVLIDKYKELQANGLFQYRLEFLDETQSDIKEIMEYAINIKNGSALVAADLEHIEPLSHYTRGHYNRGVK